LRHATIMYDAMVADGRPAGVLGRCDFTPHGHVGTHGRQRTRRPGRFVLGDALEERR
jgi:hypothetical protein